MECMPREDRMSGAALSRDGEYAARGQDVRSGVPLRAGVIATARVVGITGQADSHTGQAATTIEDVTVAGRIPARHVNGAAEIAVNRWFGQRPGMWY
jgi:hypothetical protein